MDANAAAMVGQALQVLDEGTNFWDSLGATGRSFGFYPGQRRFEFVGLQVAAGVFKKFAGEEAFGFVVLDIEIAAHAAKAVGLPQLLPAAGSIDRAAELLGIDEGFDHHDRMAVTNLP